MTAIRPKTSLPAFTLTAALAAAGAQTPGLCAPAASRPNIIVIMSDDMGFSDIGCYGGEISTPALDRLAARGVRFTQFYNNARCCPTRASLLTGLYAHQAGMGHMGTDQKLPGYTGSIRGNSMTIAEMLRPAGYATYAVGKWHVTHPIKQDLTDNWPLQRGFDKYYGTITGAGSFYDPSTLCRDNTFITPENDPEYRPARYYYTDAISDNAVRYLRDHERARAGQPFFMYVAYTAAHWPMHALPEDIARYEGRYGEGYDPVRAERLRRAIALGVLPEGTEMSPRDGGDWQKIPDKKWEARCMETYAAMVDRMDQGIARIVAQLDASGQLDNTLILFLQDNGGCAEPLGRESNAAQVAKAKYRPFGPDDLQPHIWPPMQTRDGRPLRTGPGVMAGAADTYVAYGRSWANVSNTPFREYKHWVHEGGISTPLIAHWPAGIGRALEGSFVRTPGHIIDIASTCLDVAGAVYPKTRYDTELSPLPGVSLRPAFSGREIARVEPIFWEHEGNRAVRDGQWKIVAKGKDGAWELYDMHADRSELHNLAAEKPEQITRLAAAWDAWAAQNKVKPWPWDDEGKPKPAAKKQPNRAPSGR